MGRNKAFLRSGNRTLIEIVASAVQQAADSVTIVGPPEIYRYSGFPVIPDRQPNLGPLAGIETALAHTSADWNLIVACDMPRLTPLLLRRILDEAEAHPEASCIVPESKEGFVEPLCAVYHKRLLAVISAALAGGTRKVTDALPVESLLRLRMDEGAFQNINTPEDWRQTTPLH